MLAIGQKYPGLVKQIVPSPLGLIHHDCLSDLIGRGFLGDLREVIVLGANDMFWDSSRELHWRQDAELSGFNTLCLGILHETVSRWTPEVTRVFSQTTIFEPKRPARHGETLLPVTVPDSVQVLTRLEGGARGVYHISGIDLFGPGMQIHLYGSRGTIKYFAEPEERVLIGARGNRR